MLYNKKMIARIIKHYRTGKHLNQIEKLKGMPTRMTMDRWYKKYSEFAQLMDDALDAHCEAIVFMAQEAVMNATPKTAKLVDVQQRFLTWLVSRLNRKKYGDKMEIEVTKKLDISPVLAKALANMKKVSITNPPKMIDAEVTSII